MSKLNLSSITLDQIFGGAPDNEPEPAAEPQKPVEAPVVEPPKDNPSPPAGDENPAGDDTAGEGDGEGEGDDFDVIGELAKRFGIQPESGKYTDDIEGVAMFARDYAEQQAQNYLGEVLAQYPDVSEYLEYRANGGDPQKYFDARSAAVDFDTIQVSETDTLMQKQLIQRSMTEQGYAAEDIAEMLAEYEESGVLFKQAKMALKGLKKAYGDRQTAIVEEQRRTAQEAEQRELSMWKGIAEVVKSGAATGLIIPDSEKTGFWEWMTKPVGDGKQTQRDIDWASMDPAMITAMQYLAYKKVDFQKLAFRKEQTQKAASLRDKLRTQQASNVTPVTRTKGSSDSGYKPAVKLPFSSLEELGFS